MLQVFTGGRIDHKLQQSVSTSPNLMGQYKYKMWFHFGSRFEGLIKEIAFTAIFPTERLSWRYTTQSWSAYALRLVRVICPLAKGCLEMILIGCTRLSEKKTYLWRRYPSDRRYTNVKQVHLCIDLIYFYGSTAFICRSVTFITLSACVGQLSQEKQPFLNLGLCHFQSQCHFLTYKNRTSFSKFQSFQSSKNSHSKMGTALCQALQ